MQRIVIMAAIFILLSACVENPNIETLTEIKWVGSYDRGLEIAKNENKPLLLYFWASWCPWCKKMDSEVLPNPVVVGAISRSFVPVKVDIDAKENAELLRKYMFRGTPTFVVVDAEEEILMSGDGKIPGYLVGYRKVEDFLQFLGAFEKRDK